jgi:hypothetical protein
MRIDDGVREAHLSHFCPGGMGVPVSASGPVGLAGAADEQAYDASDSMLRADAGECGRCGEPVRAGQDARRRLSGELVHATCPAPRAAA